MNAPAPNPSPFPAVPDPREEAAAAALRAHEGRFLIVSHLAPDGDAAGAAFGLCHALCDAGREAVCVGVSPVSDIYGFLLEEAPPLAEPGKGGFAPRPGDALVVVDAGEPSRLRADVRPLADGRMPVLCLDHHEPGAGFPGARSVLVEPEAGSASELVFRVALLAGLPVGRAAAEAFWTGIVTDTGRFSYDATSPATLEAGAALVARGVRTQLVAESVWGSVPLARLRLQRRFLASLETAAAGAVAIGVLAAEDVSAEGCTSVDSENFVDLARSVRGCRWAAFVRQVSPDRPVNVSLRAVPPRDAAAVCAAWGGGGHRAAAGATLPPPLDAAVAAVRDRLVRAAALEGGVPFPSRSPAETRAFARDLAAACGPGTFFALRGGLGAGKTQFVQGLCDGLSIRAAVSSPTFVVAHEHGGEDGAPRLVHLDLYRLSGPDDLESVGWEDDLASGAAMAVEWPERAGDLLPVPRVEVSIAPGAGADDRMIEIRRIGADKVQ